MPGLKHFGLSKANLFRYLEAMNVADLLPFIKEIDLLKSIDRQSLLPQRRDAEKHRRALVAPGPFGVGFRETCSRKNRCG